MEYERKNASSADSNWRLAPFCLRFPEKGAIIYIVKMKNDKEVRERMIWLLRMDITKNVNDGAKHWLRDGINHEMWELTVNDTDDLVSVVDLIEKDDIGAAFERASYLDTAVRDVIPKEVWNWMAKVNAAAKV